MKFSFEWLSQYVDIKNIPVKEICDKLTISTAEIEEIKKLERITSGLYVAEIVSVQPLDGSKGLRLVEINYGKGKTYTVCGAPNVKKGMKSVFAPAGSKISEGAIIKEQKVAGKTSQGILCSAKELDWGDSHAGIISLPLFFANGEPVSKFVSSFDYVAEIDNKSITHRADLWGHYGFAREIAAVFNKELKPLKLSNLDVHGKLPSFPLSVEDRKNCPGYCCLKMSGINTSCSPVDMQLRLLSVGLRPIDLIVDLTNYIMYEIGQPMHAFDAGIVQAIGVKGFGRKGVFRSLDGIDRNMESEDLVIWDQNQPVAIAGIMGGENSEVREETKSLLVESANFNAGKIRKTSVRLGLRTDSSQRFEKSQPPCNMALSIGRFAALLEESGQRPKIDSCLTRFGDQGEEPRKLFFPFEFISRKCGIDIPADKAGMILNSLGFESRIDPDNKIHLSIPVYRSAKDISIPDDIVEEVARIYGYNKIKECMPSIQMHPYSPNQGLEAGHRVKKLLSISKNFTELQTYSWFEDAWLKQIGFADVHALTIKNPISEDTGRLRTTLIPNLLMAANKNSYYRDNFFIYESGRVYNLTNDGCKETSNLAGIGYSAEKSGNMQELFLKIKGVVQDLLVITGKAGASLIMVEKDLSPWQRKGAYMQITLDNRDLGHIGYLSGDISKAFNKDALIAWFELSLDELTGVSFPEIEYRSPSKYPGSWMDFSMLWDKDFSFLELEKVLSGFSHPIAKSPEFMYSYGGKGLPDGKRSYTFRYWLSSEEKTLSSEEMSEFREKFIKFIESHKIALR